MSAGCRIGRFGPGPRLRGPTPGPPRAGPRCASLVRDWSTARLSWRRPSGGPPKWQVAPDVRPDAGAHRLLRAVGQAFVPEPRPSERRRARAEGRYWDEPLDEHGDDGTVRVPQRCGPTRRGGRGAVRRRVVARQRGISSRARRRDAAVSTARRSGWDPRATIRAVAPGREGRRPSTRSGDALEGPLRPGRCSERPVPTPDQLPPPAGSTSACASLAPPSPARQDGDINPFVPRRAAGGGSGCCAGHGPCAESANSYIAPSSTSRGSTEMSSTSYRPASAAADG